MAKIEPGIGNLPARMERSHPKETLQPNRDPGIERADLPQCQQNTWRETLVVGRVVSQSKVLANRAKDHFLMRQRAVQAQGVYWDSLHVPTQRPRSDLTSATVRGMLSSGSYPSGRVKRRPGGGVGLIVMMHLNDSKVPLGSNRDRHENLGDGEIGPEGMRSILGCPALQGLPVVLEVPGLEGKGPDQENMDRARRFHEEGLAAR